MQPLLPGDPQRIATYRILGRLGAGGMGVVFLAQTERGTPVAVKTLGTGGDPTFEARFAREVEAALRVSSPYTARVLDADTKADPPYLVTEYVAGETLRDHIDRLGPLQPELVTATAAGLAAGLQAIHQAGVTHRDLSATNIMLTSAGPRIIDLGIASVEEATRLTQTGTTMGTPGFMAPEHAKGEEIGPAADVFAWGSLVAFAATGASPFGTGRAEQVLYRIVHEQPSLTGLPELLVPHVTAALAKVPESRPQASELVSRLGRQLTPRGRPDITPTAAITKFVTQKWQEATDPIAKPAMTLEGSATRQSASAGRAGLLVDSDVDPEEETIALRPTQRRNTAAPAVAAAVVLFLGAGAYALWPMDEIEQLDSEVTAAGDSDDDPSPRPEPRAANLELVSEGTLTVCSEVPWEPFQFEDPDAPSGYSGFDIDLMQEIADRSDLDLVVVNTGFEGLTSGAEMAVGTCDVAASAITITEERAANVDFTQPYYSAIQSLLVPVGSPIGSIDDLVAGVTVGVQSGTTGADYVEESVPGAEIRFYGFGGDLFAALEAGAIDAILQDEPVNANRAEQDANVRVVETYDPGEHYAFALVQGRTDDLLALINSTLADMRADGFYDELFDSYFGEA